MKTTIEINGYEIVIEEVDGAISVSALKEGEAVEEFTLEPVEGGEEGGEESGDDELKAFGEEEDDFDEAEEGESEEGGESEEDLEEDEFDAGSEGDDFEEEEKGGEAPKLESFGSFIRKRK